MIAKISFLKYTLLLFVSYRFRTKLAWGGVFHFFYTMKIGFQKIALKFFIQKKKKKKKSYLNHFFFFSTKQKVAGKNILNQYINYNKKMNVNETANFNCSNKITIWKLFYIFIEMVYIKDIDTAMFICICFLWKKILTQRL